MPSCHADGTAPELLPPPLLLLEPPDEPELPEPLELVAPELLLLEPLLLVEPCEAPLLPELPLPPLLPPMYPPVGTPADPEEQPAPTARADADMRTISDRVDTCMIRFPRRG
jgi:hypothetical protein